MDTAEMLQYSQFLTARVQEFMRGVPKYVYARGLKYIFHQRWDSQSRIYKLRVQSKSAFLERRF